MGAMAISNSTVPNLCSNSDSSKLRVCLKCVCVYGGWQEWVSWGKEVGS